MMKNFRDIENLSAYLDGNLNQTDSARLETRLKSDPELDSILNDLRIARGLLRGLPARKAPRNFTLTRQMVGLKPPLPRSYPLIRFATVFAAFLFLCSITTNMLTPRFTFGFGAAVPAPIGGMGGGCDGPCEEAAATEAPAMEEPLSQTGPAATEEAFAAEMAPATEAPPEDIAPAAVPTSTSSVIPTEGARMAEPSPIAKEGEAGATSQDSSQGTANQPEVTPEPPPSINWTLAFLVIAIAGGVVLWIMRLSARNKWR